VVLVPDNLVEHYYHFLFDLALPLYLVLQEAADRTTFVVGTTPSPFLPRLNQLFGSRVSVERRQARIVNPGDHVLLGMNPFLVNVTGREVLPFAQHVRSVVGIDAGAHPPNIVMLIERLPPRGFFVDGAVKPGGGASRRHIPNHEALKERVAASVRPPFEFRNVRLEDMPFEEQVQLFARAAVVIGQHGAGLANCLWMPPGSMLVELSNEPDKSHFRRIAAVMGHEYLLHATEGAHTAVDVSRLVDQLTREPALSHVFRRA